MRYIDQSLADGETILQRGKWPMVFWVGAWAALLLLGIIIVGVFIFLAAAIRMSTTDFAVTDRRVVLKRGWLSRKTQELAVESIEGVSLNQSIIARLFGYGRIIVTGTGDAVIAFPPMAHPVAFRRSIEAARAQCNEVHLAREDRDAIERAKVEEANENEVVEEVVEERPRKNKVVEEVVEEPPRKRRRSFIGMRAR